MDYRLWTAFHYGLLLRALEREKKVALLARPLAVLQAGLVDHHLPVIGELDRASPQRFGRGTGDDVA